MRIQRTMMATVLAGLTLLVLAPANAAARRCSTDAGAKLSVWHVSCSTGLRKAQQAERTQGRLSGFPTRFSSGGWRWRMTDRSVPGCCEARVRTYTGRSGSRRIRYVEYLSQ